MSGARARPWKWTALGLSAIALVLAARLLPAGEWLGALQSRIDRMGAAGGVVFGSIYVAAALFLVPGSVLTIAAGAIFGLGWGVLIVSLASTTTAALAFLIGRYLARDRVQALARAHQRFGAVDRAIREQGWKVVFLLRSSPLVPFNVSNYVFGLTAVSFVPYLVASALGMLPGTILYVYLGAAGRAAADRTERSPAAWVLFAAGLVATILATALLARAARKKLRVDPNE